MIDTFDRPGKAFTKTTHASAGSYKSGFEDKPGKRLPCGGYKAEAGVGKARAEWRVCDAEANGPNACAAVGYTALGAGVMAKAELASASASAGPLKATVGLGVDTGAHIGLDKVEVKVLGTGFSLGVTPSISVLGSSAECCIS